jgi:hypothetical protein
MFHVSLLTPYTETPSHGPNFTQPPPDLIDGEEEYEVEQIRSHRTWGWRKTLQYLIKWKGYPESDNTWENTDQMHTPMLVKLYHKTSPLASLRAQRIQLRGKHFHNPLPIRHTTACLCSLAGESSSIATTASSSPPRSIGSTITSSPAHTVGIFTAPSAPTRFRTRIDLRTILSTST